MYLEYAELFQRPSRFSCVSEKFFWSAYDAPPILNACDVYVCGSKPKLVMHSLSIAANC